MPEPLWKTLAKRLGIELPPDIAVPTPEEQTRYDEFVRLRQEQDPTWKKAGRGLVNTVGGAIEGLLGTEPNPTRRDVGDWTNLGTQGITGLAGLPFTAYKALRKTPLTHGTQKVFDTFDPSKYDKSDVLGWMTHAAENPEYSGGYAFGHNKGARGRNPRMIPIEPEAKNVLDLVDPNPDDISAALAALPEYERKRAIQEFKDARKEVRKVKTSYDYDEYPPEKVANDLGIDTRHIEHRGSNLTYDELPVRFAAERLRLSPTDFDKTQFDAIRYNDMAEKSWAFPERTPLRTPHGVSLNTAPKDLPVIKSMFGGKGTLEVAPDRWANTPLNLPDVPPSDALKYKSNWLAQTNAEGIPTVFGLPMKEEALESLYTAGGISPEEYNKVKEIFNKKKVTPSSNAWNEMTTFEETKDDPTKDLDKLFESFGSDKLLDLSKPPKGYPPELHIQEIIKDQAMPIFPGMMQEHADEAMSMLDMMFDKQMITNEQYAKLQNKLFGYLKGK